MSVGQDGRVMVCKVWFWRLLTGGLAWCWQGQLPGSLVVCWQRQPTAEGLVDRLGRPGKQDAAEVQEQGAVIVQQEQEVTGGQSGQGMQETGPQAM